jgi:hypothetical protein
LSVFLRRCPRGSCFQLGASRVQPLIAAWETRLGGRQESPTNKRVVDRDPHIPDHAVRRNTSLDIPRSIGNPNRHSLVPGSPMPAQSLPQVRLRPHRQRLGRLPGVRDGGGTGSECRLEGSLIIGRPRELISTMNLSCASSPDERPRRGENPTAFLRFASPTSRACGSATGEVTPGCASIRPGLSLRRPLRGLERTFETKNV